jgi:hypothetical protein
MANRFKWTERSLALLKTDVSNDALGLRLGISGRAVSNKRVELGLDPRLKWVGQEWTEDQIKLFHQPLSDEQIMVLTGRTSARAVRMARYRLAPGTKSYADYTPNTDAETRSPLRAFLQETIGPEVYSKRETDLIWNGVSSLALSQATGRSAYAIENKRWKLRSRYGRRMLFAS